MTLTICGDCLNILKPPDAVYEPHPDSLCKKGRRIDFVTGERNHCRCDEVNTDGMCNMFKERAES
jgi:hypothetical protein